MTKTICIFNNKGGVGKTTFLFHIAHRLAEMQQRVLMVDCDSQCNLTAYSMADKFIEKSWSDSGNSIYRAIEMVARGLGDIRDRAPTKLNDYLYLFPGDLLLSDFEDILGDTWTGAKGGSEPAIRAQSAIYRSIAAAAAKASAEIVLIDLGPNLGALNRAVLGGGNYIIVPISPDLFSIRGTENLGNKLMMWRREWDQANSAWRGIGLSIPHGRPMFLGYVTQHHNMRNNTAGMTKGWQIFGDRIVDAVQKNIIDKLAPIGQVAIPFNGSFDLGKIPNLHSLIPYSLEAKIPVFSCGSSEGLTGAHIPAARNSRNLFTPIAAMIANLP